LSTEGHVDDMDDIDASRDIAAALAEAARTINSPRSLDETLDTIVTTARRSVTGIEHVGVSVVLRGGRFETRAGTDPLVWELDRLQDELQEGPGFCAVRSQPVVVLEHADRDPRWPRYLPQAVERGLRAQLSLRLHTDGETLGGLNLYSTASPVIAEETLHAAELFAAHAALAMGRARTEEQLNSAIGTRKTIGQAIGILMERYQLTEDRAFAFLTRASSTSNIKLRDVAQELVDTTDERHRH
jgi:GAF domain-containing protein